MIDKYEEIFSGFKKYVEDNSQYNARVVKYNTNTSSYFPIVTCVLSNNIDTDLDTIDKVERFEEFYFTIDIYTKNKVDGAKMVASQIISDELANLTMQYFGNKLNMKKTQNSPTPNLDNSILRRTIRYQCAIGSARGNIIRR